MLRPFGTTLSDPAPRPATERLPFSNDDGTRSFLCFDHKEWWMEDEERNILAKDAHRFYSAAQDITGYLVAMTGQLKQPIHGPKFKVALDQQQG